MADATTLGTWLRRERERRGITLLQISEQTKLSVAVLEGLELDDLSRWPGGIFRRAYTKSYATAIGLDPDLLVKRVEEAHPVKAADAVEIPTAAAVAATASPPRDAGAAKPSSQRMRAIAATLDLLVAGAIGLGFAAAGSRLLWPVLAIAAYHALGVLLTGRSPVLALVAEQEVAVPAPVRTETQQPPAPVRLDRTVAAARSGNRPHRHVSRRAARAARRA
jgi:transcriptional regulator with XRE-family HTH domain